jgi:hypothetical protein
MSIDQSNITDVVGTTVYSFDGEPGGPIGLVIDVDPLGLADPLTVEAVDRGSHDVSDVALVDAHGASPVQLRGH